MKYATLSGFLLGAVLSVISPHAAAGGEEQMFTPSAYTTRLPASLDDQLKTAVTAPTKVLQAQSLYTLATTVWNLEPKTKAPFTYLPKGQLPADLSWVDPFLEKLGVPSLTNTAPLFFTERFVSPAQALSTLQSGDRVFMATGFEKNAFFAQVYFETPTREETTACTTTLQGMGKSTIKDVITPKAPFFSRLNKGVALGYDGLLQALKEDHKKAPLFIEAAGSMLALRFQTFENSLSVSFTENGENGPHVIFSPAKPPRAGSFSFTGRRRSFVRKPGSPTSPEAGAASRATSPTGKGAGSAGTPKKK